MGTEREFYVDTVAPDQPGTCSSQAFAYNANSDRTGHARNTSCTPPSGTLPAVHSYDTADRLLDTGTVYDQLGRTTATPASSVTGGAAVTIGYFDNDMVQRQAQSGHTQTFTLDPSGHRIVSQVDSARGTITNNYADGGDSPAWTATPNGGWTRNIQGLNGLGAIETFTIGKGRKSTDTVALQLTDLTGNVIATVNDSAGAIVSGISDYDPFGASVGATPAPAKYGWLGRHQRAADDLGGLVLMGYRLYNPNTGRFQQTDPILGGSANPYDYALQSPVDIFDLDGRSVWSDFKCRFRQATRGHFEACRTSRNYQQAERAANRLTSEVSNAARRCGFGAGGRVATGATLGRFWMAARANPSNVAVTCASSALVLPIYRRSSHWFSARYM